MEKTKSALGGNAETPAEMSGGSPILDINGDPIDPIWAAEFRGFFWGEGTIRVQAGQPLKKKLPHINWQGHSISVSASIGLRSDDAAVLREFQRRLGGVLRTEKYRSDETKTITRWQVSTAIDCLRVAKVLESTSGLPFNKARQLVLWRTAIETKIQAGATSGSRYTPEARATMLRIAADLIELRKWYPITH